MRFIENTKSACNGIKRIVQLHSQRVQWNVFHNCTLSQADIEAQNYGKLTISWDNSILPSYCALYVGRVKISCGLLPTRFSSNFVLNSITVKKCEISDIFLIQVTCINRKLIKNYI